MRIAMISVHTCPLATLGGKDTGGMNVYVRDLTRELGRQGIGVDVFTRSQDEHQPHVKHDLGYGNRVVHVPAGPETPLSKAEIYQHLSQFVGGVREFAALEGRRYDIIHSHYWLSAVVANSLRSFWGAPFVHMAHTLGAMKNRIAIRPDELEPELRLTAEVDILRWADRIIAATVAERAQLELMLRADSRKIDVVPPGVDLQMFRPIPMNDAKLKIGLEHEARMVLFVGRIEPLKGADTLLRAMRILKNAGNMPPKLCLVIIGGDPSQDPAQQNVEMDRLKALRDELGIGNLVTFLGRRDQDSLNHYYAAADAVVMPSHYESFGMVALEAMACGTPVVASEVGGLAFLVRDGETGFTVPDRDPQRLADRLMQVLCDESLRFRLGRQAAEYAKGYAWTLIASRIIEVYKSVSAAPIYLGN